ncbi:MAG: hypothetical protein ATN33_03830, partial [Epulopiscium sp. Nele67-Bin001]
LYNIVSWGADFSFRELVDMYRDGDLTKPLLQRNYIWTILEASRFIDSILLGLPVPSIFLAKQQDEKMLIVDGYQRIMTVHDFMEGKFANNKPFKLSQSDNINVRWRGKTFVELSNIEQRKIKTTTIHSIIFQQKEPKDDTGMYQIFERINTGGKALNAQEIRNCVYAGNFNELLIELNQHTTWRKILNKDMPYARMEDMELILRFFGISFIKKEAEVNSASITLVKYLNEFMQRHKNLDNIGQTFKEIFISSIDMLYAKLGKYTFRQINKGKPSPKIHPAILDAVGASTIFIMSENVAIPADLLSRYKTLVADEIFKKAITQHTTEVCAIKTRINLATKILYGVDYEW